MTDQPSDIDTELRPAPTPADPNTAGTVFGAVLLMLAFFAVVAGLVAWSWVNSLHGRNL